VFFFLQVSEVLTTTRLKAAGMTNLCQLATLLQRCGAWCPQAERQLARPDPYLDQLSRNGYRRWAGRKRYRLRHSSAPPKI